jgi:hypothetical protein
MLCVRVGAFRTGESMFLPDAGGRGGGGGGGRGGEGGGGGGGGGGVRES